LYSPNLLGSEASQSSDWLQQLSLSHGNGSFAAAGRNRIKGCGPCTSAMTVITTDAIDRLGFKLSRRGGVPLKRDGEINR
jgi:hypothetical protein